MKRIAKERVILRKRSENPNFLASLLTILYMAIAAQGITIPDNASERLAEAIQSADVITIMIGIVPLLIVPTISLVNKVKEFGFDWAFVKDRNFVTHIVAVILLGLELGGILPPDGGKIGAAVVEAGNSGLYVVQEPATKEYKVAA